MSWEQLDDPPRWVQRGYENDGWQLKDPGDYLTVKGDTYVYKIEFPENYSRQLKSDYYDTGRNKGTCPNCQAYVRRLDGDRFLTCHRCGWTVGLPVLRWLRYPSWIDYYAKKLVLKLT
ncbi:hypothetical protein SAMN04488691_101664 [Haloferax larsenii]|uniref:Uncharacterized protein n=1 Tax=Haloferax larsenii TaxID=302484 RepID=A0A1H7HRW2_HALLR|nr:hypothetical protein SAMN04488691_101664 [Haloferax larsenii]